MISALRNTALIAVSHFGLSLATWGQSCSNASLTGLYGFAGTGTNASGTFGFAGSGSVVGVGNLANGGQVTLDGAGHLTGTESFSVAGRISSDVAFHQLLQGQQELLGYRNH